MYKIFLFVFIMFSLSFGPCNADVTQEVTFEWTAPGDDSTVGTAAEYRIAYSQSYNDLFVWDTILVFDTISIYIDTNVIADTVIMRYIARPIGGTPVSDIPFPQTAGTKESFTTTLTLEKGVWYFRIWTADEIPNWSYGSNIKTLIIEDNVKPAAIIDFSVIKSSKMLQILNY